ncbi:MAG: sporulation initiation factor Spo0A C-terminal domain-containing protein [Eubacterium sp.]|nr:sporulation initiation factor Spo0A C-terminal domain-containing protein [Eubacterium sp.]
MTYKQILNKVAKEYDTTPEEVEKEMKSALELAGYSCSVKSFIAMTASMVLQKQNGIDYK